MARRLSERSRRQIDDVMDNFDFRKVERYMRRVAWRWARPVPEEGNGRVEEYVPTEQDLRREARAMLAKTVGREGGVFGMGGFWATFRSGQLRLVFELTSWESEEPD